MKLDLGCGPNCKEGFVGVDVLRFPGVEYFVNLGKAPWPWKTGTVDEVWCSHMVEHLTAKERIHFINELYRVLKQGSKATIVTPYWSSSRAYGDLTHQWPPVVEHWYLYLDKTWRQGYAPHNTEYRCNFHCLVQYAHNPNATDEAHVNAIEDMAAILTKVS